MKFEPQRFRAVVTDCRKDGHGDVRTTLLILLGRGETIEFPVAEYANAFTAHPFEWRCGTRFSVTIALDEP